MQPDTFMKKKKSTENTANKDIKYWQHYTYWKKNTYRVKTLRITTNEWNIQLLKTHGYWKRWWYSITEHRQVLKTQDNWQHIYWKIQNNWEHTSTENTDNTNIYIYIYLQLLENTHLKMHLLKNAHNYWAQTYWKHTTTDNLYHSKHTSKNVTPESTRCTENIQLLKNTQSLRTHKNWKHTRIISDKLHHLKKTW